MKSTRIVLSPGRAAVLAAVLVLCSLPAVMMNGFSGYFPGLFLILLCAISFVYGLIVSRGLVCAEFSGEGSCRRGESVPVPVSIKNGSRLVCIGCRAEFYTTDISGGIRSAESVCFTLSSGETRDFGFDVSFDHVGSYRVGLRCLRVEGLLGVVSFVKGFSLAKNVTVLPLCHELGGLALSELVHNESIYANRVSTAASVDYSGVREYSVGDPIKLIHWNLSSHTASYMTKLLESYGSSSLTIIPCSLTPEYDTEAMMSAYDGVCECCASLGAFAADKGMETELLCEDEGGEISRFPFQSAESFPALLASLIRVPKPSDGCEELERILRHETARRYSSSNIIVCTSSLSDYAAKQIMELKRRRKNIVLFYVKPYGAQDTPTHEKALKTLRAADIELYIIPSADEIGRGLSA